MSQPGKDGAPGGPKREMTAALVVIAGVVVLALAIAGYVVFHKRGTEGQAVVHATTAQTAKQKAMRAVEGAICTAMIQRAQTLTVVPSYATLGSPDLVRSTVSHRFVCEAQTNLTHYLIAADLLCEKIGSIIGDPRCISVFRVMTKEGQLVYSRP
jgi:hypothetical protein